ncbi:phosphotransferase [Actinoplanes sp. NPDC051513]|uniref:phosphotransferase n=1 Tax=Actinoplanes sp. NPDC051513 TaxID=3363908 RepID=UPI0037ABA883
MQDIPAGVTDADLVAALRAGWGIEAREIGYLPVGAGGYHWSVDGEWFLTVTSDDFDRLERALRTALALRRGSELDFVLAAEPTLGGAPLWPLPSHHNLSVFPLVEGTTGDFGPHPAGHDRVVDMLVALHRATPAVAGIAPPSDLDPPVDPQPSAAARPRPDARPEPSTRPQPSARPQPSVWLPGREFLTAAPSDPPWTAGPYAAAAQDLLATHAGKIGRWLSDLDALAAEIGPARVVTHGEPHPGNVLHTASGPRLIDWDTVRLAPPERDLWLVTEDPFAARLGADDVALARYAGATGHRVSATALAFYQLRWTVADVAEYAQDLHRPHAEGGDAEEALGYLLGHLEG